MAVKVKGCLNALLILIQIQSFMASYVLVEKEPAVPTEYCMSEPFQPRCLKNEVILMKSATFGRMRVGRCVTAEEVDAQRLLSGDDPRFLGCSADVLSLLDRKCSGTTQCDIRLSEIAAENIRPCYPGLTVYLEVSYDCVNIADEGRSCSLLASSDPIHIIGSSASKRTCGTKSQPWIVEAPAGQRLRISLLDFTASTEDNTKGQRKQPCTNYGVIVDKSARKNVSICGGSGEYRIKELHLSRGNEINIIFYSENKEETLSYLLAVTTVGCLDIIPPEDAWLKRTVDTTVIGCYTSRQTWHLNCEEGHWIGVFGNCSQGGNAVQDTVAHYPVAEMELMKSDSWSNGQVVAMVSIGGLTAAVCLAIACMGVVLFRRFSFRGKKRPDFPTIKLPISSRRSRQVEQKVSPVDLVMGDLETPSTQQGPTYSVFLGATDLSSIAEID